MRPLLQEELDAVSGGVGLIGAGVGAAIGSITYLGSAIGSGNGSLGGFAGAVGTGAVTGFFTPLPSGALKVGASIISGSFVGFYAGLGGGFIERFLN